MSSSGMESVWRLANTTQQTTRAVMENPTSVRGGNRRTCRARQASPTPITRTMTQPPRAPAYPGRRCRTKLTTRPHKAMPITSPCASAMRWSSCRSATRATTKPTAASASNSTVKKMRPGMTCGSAIISGFPRCCQTERLDALGGPLSNARQRVDPVTSARSCGPVVLASPWK